MHAGICTFSISTPVKNRFIIRTNQVLIQKPSPILSCSTPQIGEILAIQKYGAIASLRKDTDERAFIPGWSHEHVRSGASFLVTSQGVELALKDLVAFYVDPKKKPRKEFKAVGCNVMVLKHGGKVSPDTCL